MRKYFLILFFSVMVSFLDGTIKEYRGATSYGVSFNVLTIWKDSERMAVLNWGAIKEIEVTK